jgi:hypothetical protein
VVVVVVSVVSVSVVSVSVVMAAMSRVWCGSLYVCFGWFERTQMSSLFLPKKI